MLCSLSADLVACEAEEEAISSKLFTSSKLCAYVYTVWVIEKVTVNR